MNKYKIILVHLMLFAITLSVSAQLQSGKYHAPVKVQKKWQKHHPGDVIFEDLSPATEGSRIYHNIIPSPTPYIQENARRVLQTLYWSPKDKNVPQLKSIYYTLKEYDGVSAKSGSGDHVGIVYSTKHIEKSYQGGDTARLDYETRGVLYHELTHAYQLEPLGCGTYGDGGEFWCFIESMADAVRLTLGCFEQNFQSKDRPRGGDWRKGYRTGGYFLYWIMLNKDKEFLKKFNRSAIELNPWSWDAAMKHVLGDKPENSVEALWNEYQKAIGDK